MSREHRALLRGTHARARLGLTITPMIDVVFQLLIYFLLTAGLIANERHLRAELPPSDDASARAAAEDPFALEREPLVIRLTRTNDRSTISLSSGLRSPRDAVELEVILRGALLDTSRPQGLFPVDHPIRLAPAPDVPWNDVVAAFNAVIAAGYRTVAFGGGA